MSTLPSDFLYAMRRLLRRPTMTATMTLCLAVGIGVNAAVFSLVSAILLRTPPGISHPERVVTAATRPIEIEGIPGNRFRRPLSFPQLRLLRDRVQNLNGLAAFHTLPLHVQHYDRVERLQGQLVSAGYFEALGVRPSVGRLLDVQEETDGSRTVVLGYRLAEQLFGEVGAATGQSIELNGGSWTVVGVAPRGFAGVWFDEQVDLWLPIGAYEQVVPGVGPDSLNDPSHSWLFWFVARKPRGTALAALQADLDRLTEGMAAEAKTEPFALDLTAGAGLRGGKREEAALLLALLGGAAALVLLVACANASSLMLAAAISRSRELGIRTALGAGRGGLVRLMMVEGLLLGSLGGLAGLLLAVGVTKFLEGMALGRLMPAARDLQISGELLLFVTLLSIATGLLCGGLPAMRAARLEPAQLLRSRSFRRGGLLPPVRELLVVAQVAVSLIVLICGGLLLLSFRNLQAVETGFEPAGVINVRLDLGLQGYSEADGRAFWSALLARVRSIPGVTAASLASDAPLSASSGVGSISMVQSEATASAGAAPLWVTSSSVTEGYFELLGIRLAEGRGFTSEDRQGGPQVAVINRALARKLWPNEDPVGQRLLIGGVPLEVVDVAADVKQHTVEESLEPHFYLPLDQAYVPNAVLHVKTAQGRRAVGDAVRSVVSELDRGLPVYDLTTYPQEVAVVLAQPRLTALLVGSFSLLALVLTVTGLFAIVKETVERRTFEFGVRLALGGDRGHVWRLAMGRVAILIGVGLVIGVAVAAGLSGLLRARLYGLDALDPRTYVTTALLFLVVAVAAAHIPARRASRIQPVIALKHD